MAKLSSTSVYGNLYVDGEIVNNALDAELGQSIKSLSVNGKTITYTKNNGTTGTIETQDTNTTYGNATTSTSGLMSSADKTKLDGIAANANNYSHPTTSGNKHIPAGGSSGQILRWASDGTAVWGNDNNTTYSTGTASTAGLTKLYTGIGTATDGTMTQAAIKTALDGKANSSHTHNSLMATDLSSLTVSLNDYNLSSGTPKVAYYFCPSDGSGSNITGRPNDSDKKAFNLVVESLRFVSNTDYITKQTYTQGSQKIIYVRYCTNGTWTAWEKVYTSTQKPTASEIGVLPLTGGTLSGRLTANGRISASTVGSSWISGMTITNATIGISTQQTTGSYHPVLAVKTSGNHVANIGGLGDDFGFYGFKSGRTENATDWSFKINAGTGAVSSTGNITAPTFVGALSGNASTATKLQTVRTINGTSFDGSANITTANWGTARNLQIGNSSKSVNGSANVSWSLGEIGAVPVSTGSAVTIHADSDSSSTSEYLLLKAGHNELKITSSAGGSTVTKSNTNLTYNGNQVYHAGNPQTTISGNAGTATKLQTVRTINGTNFDGSANITTANWGAARNIQIGNTTKSVNGSANVSWSLSEIGAAAASHGRHMPDTCETITDWNNATKSGWYMGNNAANGPTTVASGGTIWYFGEVIAHNTSYVIQVVYQFTASTDAKSIPKYIRAKMNGTWGAWTNVTVSKAVPSNAVFTDTNTWRGVQDNLTSTATDQSLSANQGKVLKGLIDGKAASSHTHNYAGSSSAGGAANSATKLATARSINGTNFDGTGNITTANWGTARNLNGVSVNGSTNYTIPVENYCCSVGDNNTNLYHRILTTDIATTNYTDKSLIIVMHSGYSGGGFGIAKITFRTNDISSAANSQGEIKWLVRSGFAANALVFNLVNQAKNACMDVFYKSPGTYAGMTWYVLSEGGRGGAHSKQWTKYNTNASGTNTYTEANMKTLRTYTSTLVSATDAGHVSTANSASTLTTARTINGTSFNGSANITTANWGTARNIQIGDTAKSVNGSANVSWSLSEIGAAASNHTHNNYASTSHTHSSLTGTTGSTTAPSTGTGVMRYDYNVSSANAGTLPNNSNANGILTLNTHSGNYYNQLGFSSNGNLYYRAFNGKALDTTTAWKQIAFTDSNITGNAATATKLQTVRTINGTNFDGTDNITTANWGTARTITIGSTGKSVNGSGNVSWSLSEIGAAAASHTHNYAGSSSAGGNANAAVKLATARTINGTNFDGTGNITTANWGTARNIQIGNAVKSVNGSGNVSWNWSEMQVPRAYSSSYNFGGNQNAITTEQFITMLTNLGAFSQVYWVSRGSWSYASNQYINDTGCGNIHLAGCVVEVIGTTSAYTIRVTTPTTSASGTINAEFIYVNNGTDYSPGWRRQYNTKNKPTASEIGAAAASHTHSYLPLTGGTLSGNVVLNNNIAIGSKDTSGATKWLAWIDKTNNAQFGDVAIKSVINSNANPEVNVGGKGIYTLYHTGNKPTPSEIGAAATSHTHNYLPLTGGTLSGHLVLENNTAIGGKDTSGTSKLLTWVDRANNAQFGDTTSKSVINSSVNPEVNISGKGICTLYHTGNKPTSSEIGAAPALALANGYYGMVTNDGNSSNWIRTTQNGIIPYQSGGSSSLGTSSWPFNAVYATNFHGTLNGNATHWGGRQVWWGAAANRPGNGYIQFVW